ncbi:CTP:molybdopterin cytidylyltransferase MocA [Desulfuromonas soudanensis]|uniref:CTP:molybdopterin cytidylyltransferase MocA n=2 Tax=Desulfuromonas soudanensis TaxID=1603606 RepID=A0A0M4D6Q6_9BACT|nr:CTP:molybdopterin cytidylyltransferase MocA [Desulfuromonas soudanensis]
MGRCKALLPFGDRCAIERVVATLQAAGIEEILVVLGPTGGETARVLAPTAVRIVWNTNPDSDMASSVRLGLEHLSPGAGGVMVFLADHPLVGVATVKALLGAHSLSPETIHIPCLGGKKGHPVLFPRAVLSEIRTLSTLRDVCRKDPARVDLLPVDDPAILHDLDTPEAYLRALAWWQAADGGAPP